jgi:hypothetical protein
MTTVRAASGGSAALPQLRAVSTRDDGRVSAVVIEATEPVAYVTSQPDPLTVLVDLRNVRSAGVQPPAPRDLAAGRCASRQRAADGTPLARVRVLDSGRQCTACAPAATDHGRGRSRGPVKRSCRPAAVRAPPPNRAVRASPRSGDK